MVENKNFKSEQISVCDYVTEHILYVKLSAEKVKHKIFKQANMSTCP